MSHTLENKPDFLAQKIKHIIITSCGRTWEQATNEELYQALSTALFEEVMVNWTAAAQTLEQKKSPMMFFLSMEYLPGRLLNHNILNLGSQPLIRSALKLLGKNLSDLLRCEPEPALGHGGLGRLASCFLDALATHHYPACAYGLRYQYGIFEQEIWDGLQIERPDSWLLTKNPWEQRRDSESVEVHFKGRAIPSQNELGEEIEFLERSETVRALPYETPVIGYSETGNYSVVPLRLWSTKESPRNFYLQRFNAGLFEEAAENTSLTDILYPNDNHELGKRIRLKQEFLLVSASLQDILHRTLRVFGSLENLCEKVRIQINDTHPALVIAELVRILTKHHRFSWQNAWETCQKCCGYTNHTILKEGLEEWRESRMQELLPRQHRIIQKLNQEFCDTIRHKYPADEAKVRRMSIIEGGQIRMAHLAILGSHKTNGVAKLHTKILQERLFKDFADLYPERFTAITNGITQRRWLLQANPLLSEYISRRIGRGWITDFSQIEKLREFASDSASQQEFMAIKRQNKETLLDFLKKENAIRDKRGRIFSYGPVMSSDALFALQIKRFHEYKRQLLNALHLIMVYHELIENPSCRTISRFAIFSGKAAPGYKMAKEILGLVFALGRTFAREPKLEGRLGVAVVENYNVEKAALLIPAADLSEQISLAGWEASGTGNMKLAINGALTIGTEDGANIEMRAAIGDHWWPLGFGASALMNKSPFDPQSIYRSDSQIRKAVDALGEGVFANKAYERRSFSDLREYLMWRDPFRILQDLRSYYEAQKKAEALYGQPELWAETALNQIAGMGSFSSDKVIANYAEKIWQIKPCPPDPTILEQVKKEYSLNDRCRIAMKEI